jgi:hypothetical protein
MNPVLAYILRILADMLASAILQRICRYLEKRYRGHKRMEAILSVIYRYKKKYCKERQMPFHTSNKKKVKNLKAGKGSKAPVKKKSSAK